MPTYEYYCKKCDKVFEAFQKISEKPLGKCPSCNGKVKRLLSASGFMLKGGGWYKDGYSSAKKSNEKSDKKISDPKKNKQSKNK